MAEGVGDAFAEGWREFRSVEGVAGQRKTLLTPDLPPYGGKAVGKIFRCLRYHALAETLR